MPWNDLANNQTISFTNLKDAVDIGYFSPKTSIPISNEQVTKDDVNTYVHVNTLFSPYASKASNQLMVKSNLECVIPSVINTQNLLWDAIANNETTFNPIQLIAGYNNNGDGRIFRSTDYGQNYSSVLLISDALLGMKFMPGFRHASYLSVPPFLAVGNNGRIVTNSVTNASTWVTVSSPTSQLLSDVTFNNIGVGIIVGASRILKTNTSYRINSWSIVNSVTATWVAAASDGSIFVAVGNNGSIITGNFAGTTWTTRSMPPLSPSGINLSGVTYHTDGYFYAVGQTSLSGPYIMRSPNSGISWELYNPIAEDLFDGPLYSIQSINNRLVIGGRNYQYQIINGTLTRCGASTDGVSMIWFACTKDANSTSGFDMAGYNNISNIGAYSNF